MKVAAVPWPFAKVVPPFPAKVVTFQKQGGSSLIPAAPQFAGVKQGMAGAGVPPGQKLPGAHCKALAGEVEPVGQPLPGRAVQGPVQVGVEAPALLP